MEDIDLKIKLDDSAAQSAVTNILGRLTEMQSKIDQIEKDYKQGFGAAAESVEKANKKIRQNAQAISDLDDDIEAASEAFRNYGAAIGQSITELGILNGGIARSIASMKAKITLLAALRAGFLASSKAAGTLRVALLSTGIGAIIVALGSLIAFLTKSQKGMDALAVAGEYVGTFFGKLMDIFKGVGESVFNAIINPVDTAKSAFFGLVDFIKGQVVNRFNGLINLFKAFGAGLQGLAKGDFEAVKNAAKDAGLAIVAMNTGFSEEQIVNTGKKIVGTFKEINNAALEGAKLQQRQNKLNKDKIDFMVTEAQLESKLASLKEQMSDETLSLNERKKAQLEYEKSLNKLTDGRLKMIDEEIDIMRSKQDLTDNVNADYEELNGLLVQREKILANESQLEKALGRDRRRLNKEQAEAQKQRQKLTQDELKAIAEAQKKLSDVFQGIEDALKNAQLEQLTGIERINAEYQLGQELLQRQVDEISAQIDEAEKAGVAQEEIAKRRAGLVEFEKNFRILAEQEYTKALLEEETKRFVAQSNNQAELEKLRLQRVTGSSGNNTAEEVLRVKQLEVELENLEKVFDKELQLYADNQDEILRLTADYDIKSQQLAEQIRQTKFQNQLSAIDRQTELDLLELDLTNQNGSKILSLEEFKEQERLKIIIKAQQERLKVLQQSVGADSPEAVLLEKQIQVLQGQLDGLEFRGPKDPMARLKEGLATALGVTNEQLNAIGDALSAGFNQYLNYANAMAQHAEDKLKAISDQRKTVEDELKEEEKLQLQGLANNVESKKKELDNIAAEEARAEREAEKRRKEATRAQLIAEGAQQLSAITTAVANIIKGFSSIPILGYALGIGAGVAMLGSWIALKAKAKDSVKLYTGGALDEHMPGPSRDSGQVKPHGRDDRHTRGYRVEGTNLELGGDEFVVKSDVTRENLPFLKEFNRGRFRGLNLRALAESAKQGRELARGVRIHQRNYNIWQRQENERLTREAMQAIMERSSDKLIHYFEKQQEQIIPMADGRVIKKKGNNITITNMKS